MGMRDEADDGSSLDFRRLRRREPAAVEAWFLEYSDALYAFAFYRVGKDSNLASDVVAETFLEALEGIEAYRPERGSMFSWLSGAARNRIRRALKLKRRHAPGLDAWEAADEAILRTREGLEPPPLPADLLERRETADLVRAALSNLPLRYGRVLDRHYCQRLPLVRIAAEEGLSEGAVKALLHRARLAFKAAFAAIAGIREAAPQEGTRP
jgi:RNA polymerase sigma-70 factor, ECF subfamily